MVSIIYIPVLFVCLNGQCTFMQGTFYTSQADCKAAAEDQKTRMEEMAAKAKQSITLLQGTCITAKGGML